MARPSYSTEQVKAMCEIFIDTTSKIIKNEGIENVTIRNVAKNAGYKSATLYHYFRDLDHLLVFASLNFFKEYADNLSNYIPDISDPYLKFISIWEMFCSCTFKQPLVFHKLFFGKHSEELSKNIKDYYCLFPSKLTQQNNKLMLDMLLSGNLYERNMTILLPLIDKGLVTQKDAKTVNKLMIFSYKEFLEKKIKNNVLKDDYDLIEELIDIFKYLLGKQQF